MATNKPITVDDYISRFSPDVQEKLQALRNCLRLSAPHAKEMLKWGQPAFEAEHILFVYGGFKNHISLHPTPDAITTLKSELKEYISSENTLRFALDKPLPLQLIARVADLRVKQCSQGIKWK
jgi:uncharacterized protein YdhG (YjbR/CyaY superfamily)